MSQPVDPPNFDRSLTRGPLAAAVWKITWPTLMINIASGIQGLVDHVCVGRFVGYEANAGVGVGWQIFAFFIVFINSVYGGVGVLVARFAGADEPEKVHRTFTQAFLFSAVFSLLVFAPMGYFFAPQLLDLVNASPGVRAEATPYLRTLFLFNAGLVLFFLIAIALRAAGDARTPMRLTLLMTGVNLVLTLILVGGPGPIPSLGTRGAAFSTVASGGLVAMIAIYQLLKRRLVVRLLFDSFVDSKILGAIFRFGLPMGIQGLGIHLASLVLVRYVGSLESSAEAQAAYFVAYAQIYMLINLVAMAAMAAAATVAGQNLGARRQRRVARTPGIAVLVALAINLPLALLFFFASAPLLSLFGLEGPLVLALGGELLRYLSLATVFVTAGHVYIGALQGIGDTKRALAVTLFAQLIVPVGFCAALEQAGQLTSGGIWFAIALGHAVRSVLAVICFRKRHIAMDTSDDPGKNYPV